MFGVHGRLGPAVSGEGPGKVQNEAMAGELLARRQATVDSQCCRADSALGAA